MTLCRGAQGANGEAPSVVIDADGNKLGPVKRKNVSEGDY